MRLPWWLPLGSVPEIEAQELAQRLKVEPELQLVDVRSESEYASGHIRGARSVPIQNFRKTYPSLGLDPGQPVMVVCLSSHRSLPAVRLLNNDGYDSYQLANGMNAWLREGLPTVTD